MAKLTDTEILQAIADLGIALRWQTGEDEEDSESDQMYLELSAFPSATGGTWTSCSLHTKAGSESADRLKLLRRVVTNIVRKK